MFAPAPNAVVGGKYRLDRPLAHGGMGSVWAAWQVGLDRPVAIKFMARELSSSPVARLRFDREARAAAQLRTPHVVQMHDHGIEDDTPFLVMELLEGEDLNVRLRRERHVSLAEAAKIASQVARALRRAQEAGVVHRDLKPANIFLARADDDEVVKVLDFGIARVADSGQSPVTGESTQSGAVVGSPHYMAPEQARGMSPLDHRADLWSLGVILFRLTTGSLPFPGQELGDIIIRVYHDPHPAPTSLAPHLPPALDAFFERALAKDPAQRFQSAPELAAAFAAAAGVARPEAAAAAPGETGPTPPSLSVAGFAPRPDGPTPFGGSHELSPRPASRVPVAVWLIAALGLLGLGAGALIMALRPSTPAAPVPAAESAAPQVPSAAPPPSVNAAPNSPSPSIAAPPAPSASEAAMASAMASASAAPVAPTASARAPRSGGRKGYDFGY